MAKPNPISGFPEWLPEQRAVELRFLDHLRRTFELYGFCSLETASVERVETITAKGEVDKEIYCLRRLQAEPGQGGDAELALHFDLTVPLARYVAQNFGKLSFPFKRYQIQKSWRGERPQEGRYREFYQCDIDVIGNGSLPLHFDAEMPAIMHEIFDGLGLKVRIRLNNRKVLQGFYAGLGIEDATGTLRIVDKLAKIGREKLQQQLVDEIGLEAKQAEQCLALGSICTEDASFAEQVSALGIDTPQLAEGLEELRFVQSSLSHLPTGAVVVDMSVSRGLDYYTGTVYETELVGHEDLGAICSGGRYDDLASGYTTQRLPGVGISLGLTRLLGRLFAREVVPLGAKCPTQVLVILLNEERRGESLAVANTLRARGLNTEVFHLPRAFGKQIKYANQKGIPYVWFPPFDEGAPHEVKDLGSGEQGPAELETWMPAE